jgi:hypothetical protein
VSSESGNISAVTKLSSFQGNNTGSCTLQKLSAIHTGQSARADWQITGSRILGFTPWYEMEILQVQLKLCTTNGTIEHRTVMVLIVGTNLLEHGKISLSMIACQYVICKISAGLELSTPCFPFSGQGDVSG